jgi:anti-sigma-K factor RskA
MTAQDHDRWSDSVGAWVLGALPEEERVAFEAHLARCPVCRDEEAELRLAANALPAMVPQVAPDPALRDRIMRVVESEAELLAAAGPEADRPRRARAPRRSWRFWRMLPVPLAAAALAAGAAVVVVGGAETRTVPAQVVAAAGSAKLEIRGDSARLVGARLPAPPAGRVYQVWLQHADGAVEPTSALFSVDRDGRATVDVPGDLDDVEKVMVTDEPPSGSERPTGKLLLSAAT